MTTSKRLGGPLVSRKGEAKPPPEPEIRRRRVAEGRRVGATLYHIQKLRAGRQRRGFDTGFALEGGHGVVIIDPRPQLLRHVPGGRVP